jgi:hypothetical protein
MMKAWLELDAGIPEKNPAGKRQVPRKKPAPEKTWLYADSVNWTNPPGKNCMAQTLCLVLHRHKTGRRPGKNDYL